jgi:precorrin-2 dehydrogenase/sirohydrochlorin ferrochelatase
MNVPQLFPLFLKLEKRRCLLVGAGAIAEQKLEGLLVAGAEVVVVAPEASGRIRELSAESRITWLARPYIDTDLDRTTLVIAATGNPTVNEQIFRDAESRGILCNAVDEPERCHFYYPAVVRRGDLQIAISTNGKSPALAQRIRAELEAQFESEYADWLEWLGAVRTLFFQRPIQPEQRRSALHRIAAHKVYERYRSYRQRRRVGVSHG